MIQMKRAIGIARSVLRQRITWTREIKILRAVRFGNAVVVAARASREAYVYDPSGVLVRTTLNRDVALVVSAERWM